jgi:mediator of RNA polymerase II transcription subunit 10
MDLSQNTALGTGGIGGNGMLAAPVNDTAAATAVDDPKQNLNQVINSIQKTLGLLHQLYITVSSFNTASQLPLLQRLYFSINLFVLGCYLIASCFGGLRVYDIKV